MRSVTAGPVTSHVRGGEWRPGPRRNGEGDGAPTREPLELDRLIRAHRMRARRGPLRPGTPRTRGRREPGRGWPANRRLAGGVERGAPAQAFEGFPASGEGNARARNSSPVSQRTSQSPTSASRSGSSMQANAADNGSVVCAPNRDAAIRHNSARSCSRPRSSPRSIPCSRPSLRPCSSHSLGQLGYPFFERHPYLLQRPCQRQLLPSGRSEPPRESSAPTPRTRAATRCREGLAATSGASRPPVPGPPSSGSAPAPLPPPSGFGRGKSSSATCRSSSTR